MATPVVASGCVFAQIPGLISSLLTAGSADDWPTRLAVSGKFDQSHPVLDAIRDYECSASSCHLGILRTLG